MVVKRTNIYKCNVTTTSTGSKLHMSHVCTKINLGNSSSNSTSNSTSNSNSNSNSNSSSKQINVNSLLKPYNASKVTTLRSKKELPRLKQSKKKVTFMKKCHEVRSNSDIPGKKNRTQDTKDRCKDTKDENGNQCIFSSKKRCKKRN
jgi:hypothetical protein